MPKTLFRIDHSLLADSIIRIMNALLLPVLDRYLAFIISIIRIVYVIGVGSDAARARFSSSTNGSGAPASLVRLGPGIAALKQKN